MTSPDHLRARAIVQRAAALVSDDIPSVKTWLAWDERGSWERTALEYLTKLHDPAIAAKLEARPMTDDEIDDEIAGALKLLALKASVADARKRAAQPRKDG